MQKKKTFLTFIYVPSRRNEYCNQTLKWFLKVFSPGLMGELKGKMLPAQPAFYFPLFSSTCQLLTNQSFQANDVNRAENFWSGGFFRIACCKLEVFS